MHAEALFYEKLCGAVEKAHISGNDARLRQTLADAKHDLDRSGVPETRQFSEIVAFRRKHADISAWLDRTMADWYCLRSCALASCGAKELYQGHFQLCAACRAVVYCCKEHSVEDWPSHQAACKAVRKAATAAGAASGPSGGA